MTAIPSPEHIGYLAALLTTASFVPQVVHTLRTRDVSGISVGMYSVFTTGVALWLAYGVMIEAWPVIAANFVTLVLAAWILWLKLSLQHQGR
ncbi:SemiSWEET transporter [Ideonella sp. A 288]|uniref:SemiSWEET transporter n=1 Tax=Ideonella sp. A 288 TaxID=1962181 RepID=UPI000B4A749F|nr:SemiSWEET transporter [Ideonella sp. A 288]